VGDSLREFLFMKFKTSRLNRLRKKQVILSFRAKRGISPWFKPRKREIPRFARNDKSLSFSATSEACATGRTGTKLFWVQRAQSQGWTEREDPTRKMLPPVRDRRRQKRFYLQIYLEKLAMAADSVGKTSNTVTNFVTCRIS